MNRLLIFSALTFFCCRQQTAFAQASAWRCYVIDFATTPATQRPDEAVCNYVSGNKLQLPRAVVNSNDYFTHIEYNRTICLSENFEFEVRIQAGANVGGIPAYDVGLGIGTAFGRVSAAMMSNDRSGQPWTSVTVAGVPVLSNSPLLVRDFTNWATMRMRIQNRILTLFYNNTAIYTAPAPLPVAICSANGFFFYFKGSGAIDYVKFRNLDNNTEIYNEEFTSCTNMAAPQPCPTPSVNLSAAPVCEGDTLKLLSTISPQPTSVEWTGPNGFTATTPNLVLANAALNQSGTYTLKANYNACIAPVMQTITAQVNPKPLVNLGNDTAFCAPASHNLNAMNLAATYSWSNGTTNPTLNVSQTGNYSVTVSSANGCKTSDTIAVQVHPKPLLNLGNDTAFCAPTNHTLNAGLGFTSYLWSNGATSSILNVAQTGNFSVTVTAATGCKASDTIRVQVNPKPNINLGKDTVFCAPSSYTLNPGGGGSTYRWNIGTTNPTLNVVQSGTYSVTVTSAAGCRAADTVQVSFPLQRLTTTIESRAPTCFGSCNGMLRALPQGGYAPYSFVWTATNGNRDSITNLCADDFGLTVRDNRGCILTSTASLVDPPRMSLIAKPDSNFNGFAMRCGIDTIGSATASVSGGNGGYSFKWNSVPVQTTAQAKNLRVGSFKVVVTDRVGCKDSAVVELKAPPAISIGYEVKHLTCFGEKNGEIRLGAVTGGAKPFTATLGALRLLTDSAQIFKNLAGGDYPYFLVDANQCSVKLDLKVIEPPKMNISMSRDTLIHFGDEVSLFAQLNAPSVLKSILWKPSRDSIGMTCFNCISAKASPRKTTIFQVILTDDYGCSLKKEVIVQVDKLRKVFVPTAFSPNEDGQNERFSIMVGNGIRRVNFFRVFNRWGQLVFEKRNYMPTDDSQGWDGRVDGKFSPVETYVWVAEIEFDDNEKEVFKGDVTVVR